MKYTLSEYSYLTGCGHTVGSAGSADLLPWEEVEGLNTYDIVRGSAVIAEFCGGDADEVCDWLFDHPDYDGRAGVKAWRGQCAWCDKALVDGKCDCVDFADHYKAAEDRDEYVRDARARLAADNY